MSSSNEADLTPILLKLREDDLDANDPWKDDALDRQSLADTLTNLIRGETNSLVLGLNGDWGSGKTFLLKRWRIHLTKQGFRTLYFNAWEDDSSEDPLVAIVGQLWDELKNSDFVEIGTTLKEVAKSTFIEGSLHALGLMTSGFVDFNSNNLKSTAEHAIEHYARERTLRINLRSRLSDATKKLTRTTPGPLVFIIDELDRCRPTFAVELLERVKHLLAIPNIVFVFGLDRKQLGTSIQSIYGPIDVDGYLRRFFDMEFVLPEPSRKKYCELLVERHHIEDHIKRISTHYPFQLAEYNDFLTLFSDLSEHFTLSLRDIEHCIRVFVLAARNSQAGSVLHVNLLAVLILLRCRNHDLYMRYTKSPQSAGFVLDYLDRFVETHELGDAIEATIYAADFDRDSDSEFSTELNTGDVSSTSNLLSKRTRNKAQKERDLLFGKYRELRNTYRVSRNTLRHSSKTIELAMLVTQRA